MAKLTTIDRYLSMENIDIKFENAVRIVIKRLREFEEDPVNREYQYGLFRALRRAKFLYDEVYRRYGKDYNGGSKKLHEVVIETSELLSRDKICTNTLRGVKQQIKEILHAYEESTIA